MIIREFREKDLEEVEAIFATYWTDPEFIDGLVNKLYIFIDQTKEAIEKKYRFFVAEEDGKILGVAGMRVASEYMRAFAKTSNPCEFYVSAVKKGYKRRRIGNSLRVKRLEETAKLGFTEIVLYSPNSHKESWSFHDRHGFERVGPADAPDGEPGMIWRKVF